VITSKWESGRYSGEKKDVDERGERSKKNPGRKHYPSGELTDRKKASTSLGLKRRYGPMGGNSTIGERDGGFLLLKFDR